ncbi:MAG: LysM peptidoglycan-binding domain-containing protein, partial [Planctomycetota bacterium]
MLKCNKTRASWFSCILTVLLSMTIVFWTARKARAQDETGAHQHMVQPGDSWTALSWQYGVSISELQSANPHPNRQRQPTIGRFATIPAPEFSTPRPGYLHRLGNTTLLT